MALVHRVAVQTSVADRLFIAGLCFHSSGCWPPFDKKRRSSETTNQTNNRLPATIYDSLQVHSANDWRSHKTLSRRLSTVLYLSLSLSCLHLFQDAGMRTRVQLQGVDPSDLSASWKDFFGSWSLRIHQIFPNFNLRYLPIPACFECPRFAIHYVREALSACFVSLL